MNPSPKSRSASIAAPSSALVSYTQLQIAEMQLRETTVRITAARIKVLAALLGASCALSHQDMQDQFADMDRVTLYRALDCLTDANLAHKIAGDDRVFRYSAGTESANLAHHVQHQHGHFKCTRCSKVFCLESNDNASFLGYLITPTVTSSPAILRQQLQQALQNTLGKGFQGHDIELTIKGWCANCSH